MIKSRRKFLKTLTVGIIGTNVITSFPVPTLAAKYEKGIEIQKGYIVFSPNTQKVMEALAEAIVPGSKDIDIKAKVMDYVNKDRGAATFFDAGMWNIDSLSRSRYEKPFFELTDKKEIKTLVKYVEQKNKTFFNQFRYLVIRLYYSNEQVWKRLSYNGPPQTKGFLDYSEPPKQVKQ